MGAFEERRKWFSLAAVNMGNFVPPLDTGIMSLILPTISGSLKVPIELVLWVPLTSLITTAAFLPIFGRFSDGHGRKRYFLLGLALFAVGAYLSGNSLTIYELLGYRVIQSLGGAFILANGRALIADAFPPKERGFALGTHVSVIYIGTTVGVAITGAIVSVTQAIGWRYVFYASAAIAALTIPLAILALRESPRNTQVKSDWPGALTFAAALGTGLIALTAYANGLTKLDVYIEYISIPGVFYEYVNADYSIPVYVVTGLAIVCAVAFVFRERRTSQPLIDFGMFRTNSMFSSTNFSALFLYTSHYSTLILLSYYLEVIKGVDPLTAGLLLTVEPLSVTVFSIVGGWIASRTGSRDPAIVGLGILAASLLLLGTTSQGSSNYFIAFFLGMLGMGVGIFAPNNTNANLGSVPPEDRARANGILGMMRHTGQSLSLALSTVLIGYYIFSGSPALGGHFTPASYISAMDLNFVIGAVLAIIGAYFAYRGRESWATHDVA